MVKADCYSNGLLIAKYIENEVSAFAVANVFEAVNLRKLGINKPILSLSFCPNDYHLCKIFNVQVSLSSIENYLPGLKYHIALDTGMNRVGFKDSIQLEHLLDIMYSNDIIGVYSHIYSQNAILINSQIEKYKQLLQIVKCKNNNVITHFFASNAIKFNNFFQTDYVRLGIKMYDNAIAVYSRILLTKTLKSGECVGYDGTFVADKGMQIAIVEGGYFDGILRRFSGHNVAINTDFCKVIGKISMDSFAVDITDKTVNTNDKVVIYDNDKLSFKMRADSLDVSEYELMTALKGRYNYVYYN